MTLQVYGTETLRGTCQFVEGSITIKPIVHEIRIQNQVIFLDPPIEYARSTWIKQLHDWLGKYFLVYGPSRGADPVDRCHMPTTAHPKFSVRNWAANATQRCIGDNLHVTGTCFSW